MTKQGATDFVYAVWPTRSDIQNHIQASRGSLRFIETRPDVEHVRKCQISGVLSTLQAMKGVTAKVRNGAQKRTRTSTPLRAPAPEAGASTNSAIWARGTVQKRTVLGRRGRIAVRLGLCQRRFSKARRIVDINFRDAPLRERLSHSGAAMTRLAGGLRGRRPRCFEIAGVKGGK